MDERLVSRVRLLGAGLQTSLLGLAVMEYSSAGFALVFFGAVVTLWGVV
ncbi:hypothetical protein [Halorussus pelagicus]|nr:hypothetical protein [Halorussus pelagicus]